MSGETLKPCPWCGGEAEISQIGNEHTKSRGFEVKCKTWGCSTVKRALVVRHTMAEARLFAVERWNTRPTPTVEGGELVERLRELHEFLRGAGKLKGHDFGTRPASETMFWWRKHLEPLAQAADAIAGLQAELAEARKERDGLRWAIMGGEDAPGLLDTLSHEYVLEALAENRSALRSFATQAEAQRDAAVEALEGVRAYILEHEPRCYLTEGGFGRRTAFREIAAMLPALASLSPAKDEDLTHD